MNAREVMLTIPVVLAPDDTIAAAVHKASASDLDILPVADATGRFLGAVSKADLVRHAHDPDARVGQLGSADILVCHPDHPLERLDHDPMSSVPHRTVVVVDEHGRLCGMVPWVNWAVDEARTQSGHPRSPMEVRTLSMHLHWRCLDCGYLSARTEGPPVRCPHCGAEQGAFALHTED